MHLIKYTLTNRGQTPDYVDGSIISGGQFPRANGQEEPKDWTMIGVGDVDPADLPFNCLGVIETYDELLAYMNEYLEDATEPFPFSVEESAQLIWSKFEEATA